jgi:hypothetical protein
MPALTDGGIISADDKHKNVDVNMLLSILTSLPQDARNKLVASALASSVSQLMKKN